MVKTCGHLFHEIPTLICRAFYDLEVPVSVREEYARTGHGLVRVPVEDGPLYDRIVLDVRA